MTVEKLNTILLIKFTYIKNINTMNSQYMLFISSWEPNKGCPLCFKPIFDDSIYKHLLYDACKMMTSSSLFISQKKEILSHFLRVKKEKYKEKKQQQKISIEKNVSSSLYDTLHDPFTSTEFNVYGLSNNIEYSEVESDRIARMVVGNLGVGGKYNGQQYFLASLGNDAPVLLRSSFLKKSKEGRKLVNWRYNHKGTKDNDQLTSLLNKVSIYMYNIIIITTPINIIVMNNLLFY